MPEWLGKTIGKVRIDKLLARGGMAEVYLGLHLTLDRLVAVKFLHSYIEEEPFLLERFHREAKVVAGLRHPNIVQVFDFDTIEGHPYIVMEYLKGPTLAAYLRNLHQRKKRIPSDQVARLLHELSAALDYAHGQGVVHRDIKPSNILLHNKTDDIPLDKPLTNDVEVVITDFGLVRIINTASQTASGMLSGTPAYMSPEQARGDPIDHRTDIYSLGIVLYEMLAGRVPFEADSTLTVLHMQIHTTPPPIPGIAERVQEVIDRALLKNPADRYQTSRELAKDYYRSIGMILKADTMREPYPISPPPIEASVSTGSEPSPKPTPTEPEPRPKPAPTRPEPSPKPTPVEQSPMPAPITPGPLKELEPTIKPEPAKELEAVIKQEPAWKPGPVAKPEPMAKPEPPSKPARSRAWIGVGLVSLVLLSLAAWWFLFGRGGQTPKSTETLPPTANADIPLPSATPGPPDHTNMVQIPAGTYEIGRDPADVNHIALKNIQLDSFWIDQYQITNAAYQDYIKQTGAPTPVVWPAQPDEEKHPVRGVPWDQANAYCKWQNKRLPKEAEWEAAGRGSGSDPQLYPWGRVAFPPGKLPEENTYEVGTLSFNVSPFGVYDMVGNVWEWVGELYDDNLPTEDKILRGGRYSNFVDLAFRLPVAPDNTNYIQYAGFRCAAD